MAYDVHMQRSAGWSAIAFAVVTTVGVAAGGIQPSLAAPGTAIDNYFVAHRAGLLFAAWLQVPAIAFWLWFVVGLRGYLRDAAKDANDGLATYMLLGGTMFAVVLLIDLGFSLAMVYPPIALTPMAMKALYLPSQIFGLYAFIPGMIFAFATAHSMRRHRSGPPAVVLLGYAVAAVLACGTLTIFGRPGFFAVGGMLDMTAALLVLIWVLLLGLVLIRRPLER